jgi:RNA polymerase sigma-70 factor (ECF subfamily)
LYSYVSYRSASREEAEDIVAMVFEQILAKFHTFNPKRGSLDTWIFSIARNALTDRHRYRSRHREHALEDYLELEADISLSDQFLKREELEQLRNYLGRLTEREQELLVLRYGAGLPHRRIGELMKMNEGNVAVYLSRILRKLHRFFEEDAEEKASLGLQG